MFVPGSENSKYKGPEWKVPSMLEEQEAGQYSQRGVRWIAMNQGGEGQQIAQEHVGHGDDSGFCTEGTGCHGRIVSRIEA